MTRKLPLFSTYSKHTKSIFSRKEASIFIFQNPPIPVTTNNKLISISTPASLRSKNPRSRSSDPLSPIHLYTITAQEKRRGTDGAIQVSPGFQIVVNVPSLRRGAAALFSSIDQNYALAPDSPLFNRPRFNNRRVSQLKLTLPSLVDALPAPGCVHLARPSAPETRPPARTWIRRERGREGRKEGRSRWWPTCSRHRVNKCRRRRRPAQLSSPDRFDRSLVDARLNSLWRNFRL